MFSSHSSVPKISIDDLDNSSYNQKCQSAQIVTHQQLGEVSSMKSDARSVNIDDDDFDNMDKKVDQIIQLTHPDNMIGKSNSKGGSKRRLYHLRRMSSPRLFSELSASTIWKNSEASSR